MTVELGPIERAWHPVARSSDLTSGPLAMRLFGRKYVAFRDAQGSPAALPAECPHRGTDLSLGRVIDGELRCPYHGWTFDGGGRCTSIPSLPPTHSIPAGAHTQPFRTCERDGLVWMSLDPDADPTDVFSFPTADADDGMRVIVGETMVWRTSAGRHIENILDLGHFPFVHPASFGCPEAEQVHAHEVTVTSRSIETEVDVTTRNPDTPDGPLYPGLGPTIRLGYHYRVDLPYRLVLDFRFPDGMRRALHEVVTPTAPDECTIYWCLLVDRRLPSPDEDELAFAHQVFAEDQPIIESQPPGVPIDRRAHVHVPADRLAVAFRRAMREFGVEEGALV